MNTQQKIEEKVFSFLDKQHMICPRDRLLLGVSGGADSVCLLFVLLEYAKRVPLSFTVVHVNHGIRPDAAEDASYVEELCRSLDIPFFLEKADVRGYAAAKKCSEEDAGRQIRYEAFRRVAGETGADKIAVAHNANDRAETMLFHLFRGSGLKGLSGIQPVRGEIIRPILCLERREIEDYLRERGIPWCTDSTNDTDKYTRNRIRHHILPYAEQELVQGCVEHMAQTADILWETETYMEEQTRKARESCVQMRESAFLIDREVFLKYHPAIKKRLLLSLAQELSPTGKDIAAVHVSELMSLFSEEGNRIVHLPSGIRGERSYDRVILKRQQEPETSMLSLFVPVPELEEGKKVSLDLGEAGKMEFTVFSGIKNIEVPRNQYTKWFDYDKIEESLNIRSRETGDFLSISDGQGGLIHKSLKDYMITEKIPRELRDRLPLLAEGHHVLWIAGYRISEQYKINENTKRILQVQLKGSCFGGKTEEENGRTY